MDIIARFDQVGHFTALDGKDKEAKRAHYIFGNIYGDPIVGGFYLHKDTPFPPEGIHITLEKSKGEKVMHQVYCSNCGKRLAITRKALPKYSTIIDLVEWHECSAEPIEFDLTPVNNTPISDKSDKSKFVQKLNELNPRSIAMAEKHKENYGPHAEGSHLNQRPFVGTGTDDLGDRRVEGEIKSTAPSTILDMIDGMRPTIPDKDLPPESEE